MARACDNDLGERSKRTYALGVFALSSIVALVAIRVYAVFCTTHIVTWDDRWYRRFAYAAMAHTTLADAIFGVLLPNLGTENGHKTIGYHSWMIMMGKVFPNSNTENIWHLMNVGFLIVQCCLIFGLALWATRRRWLALIVTYFYLSCPILFGINRWLLTENHVITALLSFCATGVLLLEYRPTREPDGTSRNALHSAVTVPALAGYVFGVFSTLREYALPSLIVITAAIVLGLIAERRLLSAMVFLLAFLPFAMTAAVSLPPVLRHTLMKSALMNYFHPLWRWVPHVLTFGIGWPLTVLLVAANGPIYRSIREAGGFAAEFSLCKRSGLRILFWAHGLIALVYVLLVIFSNNRVVRPSIPPLVTLFCMTLLGLRIHRIAERIHWSRLIGFFVPLAALSWGFMIFELFIAFHGGRTYRLHPFPLERYNHPLRLRALKGPDDMHVIPARHSWEYTYPPKVDE